MMRAEDGKLHSQLEWPKSLIVCASSSETQTTDVYRSFATLFFSTVLKVCQPTSVLLRCFAETKSTVRCLGALIV